MKIMVFSHRISSALLGVALIFALLMPAQAASLVEAKEAGFIGERQDGYLGYVIDKVPQDVVDLVTDINAKRKLKYQEISQHNRTDLKAVEALAGKKAIEKTAQGLFVQMPDGHWVKK